MRTQRTHLQYAHGEFFHVYIILFLQGFLNEAAW